MHSRKRKLVQRKCEEVKSNKNQDNTRVYPAPIVSQLSLVWHLSLHPSHIIIRNKIGHFLQIKTCKIKKRKRKENSQTLTLIYTQRLVIFFLNEGAIFVRSPGAHLVPRVKFLFSTFLFKKKRERERLRVCCAT